MLEQLKPARNLLLRVSGKMSGLWKANFDKNQPETCGDGLLASFCGSTIDGQYGIFLKLFITIFTASDIW